MKRSLGTEDAGQPSKNARTAPKQGDRVAEVVEGNLLECKADVIAHQCNCVTLKGRGLYTALVEAFPFADTYSKRSTTKARPRLGSIEICKSDDSSGPRIACMFAQLGPGKPNQSSKKYGIKGSADTADKRLDYFEACLGALAKEATAHHWKSIAFPYKIGCGLAGGDWERYSRAIDKFASSLPSSTEVFIYKRD